MSGDIKPIGVSNIMEPRQNFRSEPISHNRNFKFSGGSGYEQLEEVKETNQEMENSDSLPFSKEERGREVPELNFLGEMKGQSDSVND